MRTVRVILALVLGTVLWPGSVGADPNPVLIRINGITLDASELVTDSSTTTPRPRFRRILGHEAFVVEGTFGTYTIGRCPGCRGPARLVIEDGVPISGVNRLVLTDAIIRVAPAATPAQLAPGLTMLFDFEFTTSLGGDTYTHGVIMDGTFACRGTGRCIVPADNRISVSAFGREVDDAPNHLATFNLIKPGGNNVEPSLGFTVSKTRSFARQGTEGVLCDTLERDCPARGQLKVLIRFGAAGDSVTLPGSIGLLSATEGGEAGRLQVEQAMSALLTCTQPPAGLVSWFPGQDSAEDVVGGNHGALQNGADFGEGQVGQGFSLDGIDDFVQTVAPVGLPLGGAARTMMLWFRTPVDLSASTESALVQYGANADGRMFGLITSANAPGKLYFFGHGFPGFDLPGTTTLQPDTWYHGAVTYDGTTVKLYLDGELEASAPRALDTLLDAQGLTIGFRSAGSIWQGELDEVMIFDRALPAEEIAAVHDAAAAGLCRPTCASPVGLVARWAGNGDAQDPVGGNDGTRQGDTGFAPGIAGQAFNFDGAADFVQTSSRAWGVTTTLTVAAWIKTIDPLGMIFSMGHGASQDEILLAVDGAGHVAILNHSSLGHYTRRRSTSLVNTGEWVHVAGVLDGGGTLDKMRIFVNGVEETGTTEVSGTPVDVSDAVIRQVILGWRTSGFSGDEFTGQIDEVLLFNRALSAAEIKRLHDARAASLCSLDPFLCYKSKDVARAFCSSAAPANQGQACSGEAVCGGTTGTTSFCVPGAFAPTAVTLVGPLESTTQDVDRRVGLCTPAGANGAGVADDVTHLTAYKVSQDADGLPHQRRTGLVVTNQFGTLTLNTIEADRLLVPAAKDRTQPVAAPDAAGHLVDHFACYKVKVTAKTPKFRAVTGLPVADQFVVDGKDFDLKKPIRLCVPADKNEERVKQAGTALLCYQAKPSSGEPAHVKQTGVFVADQFGEGRLDTIKEEELCVPSTLTVP